VQIARQVDHCKATLDVQWEWTGPKRSDCQSAGKRQVQTDSRSNTVQNIGTWQNVAPVRR